MPKLAPEIVWLEPVLFFLGSSGGSPLNSYANHASITEIEIAVIGTCIKSITEHTESGAFAVSAVARHLM